MELSRVQRLMQAFIVGALAESDDVVENLLAVSKNPLAAAERLNMYRDTYWRRLHDSLATDYPALERFLSTGQFARLAKRYIAAVPPRGPVLHGVGDGLPEFIESLDRFPRRAAAADVGRVERASARVLTAAMTPVLNPAALRAIRKHALARARLTPVAALELVSCRYPAARYVRATYAHTAAPAMRPKKTWTAVYRRNDTVCFLDLTFPAHQLLSSIVAGQTLGVAVDRCLSDASRLNGVMPASLFGWFREWTAAGYFQRIEVVES